MPIASPNLLVEQSFNQRASIQNHFEPVQENVESNEFSSKPKSPVSDYNEISVPSKNDISRNSKNVTKSLASKEASKKSKISKESKSSHKSR